MTQKFKECHKCEYRNDDPADICDACEDADQFEESFDADDDDFDEDDSMLSRRVFMMKEAA